MRPDSNQFLVSTELECQSYLHDQENREDARAAISAFLSRLPREIPCLPAESGWFTPYGRVYCDCGHVELAAIECDSPYQLPSILERMQLVCRRVIAGLDGLGGRLRLANNNHSGLLEPNTATWGSHENYLVEKHPTEFTAHILPFLATRFYGGAGGVQADSGNFVASVRARFIHNDTGGSTTECRALHSTCREEHFMGEAPKRFRYHLLLGDGKRSHFNIALQFGATALALKAILFDDGFLKERLRRLDHAPLDGSWVTTLHELNVLARPGYEARVDPRALLVQRTYFEAARRLAQRLTAPPSWIARALYDWHRTLTAAEEGDLQWLATRLDAFAKHQLFSARLVARGRSWREVRGNQVLLTELALLDHSWHEFTSPDSCFENAERAGLIDHRVGPLVEPGGEAEPFVPEVATRARPRARFLVENAGSPTISLDWSIAVDFQAHRRRELQDPFAEEFTPWKDGDPPVKSMILEGILNRRRAARARRAR